MPLKSRPRLVASSSSATKLFVDDLREVAALSNSENKSRSDVIRELVHEALRLRRLRAIGRDEGENYLRRIHQEAISDGLAPLVSGVAELRLIIESLPVATALESQSSEGAGYGRSLEALTGLVAHLLQRAIVTENVVKVLMTVGMQKDDLGPEEIKKQLASYDETGLRQSQDLMKRILGDPPASGAAERA